MLPGAGFAVQTWGRTIDEPIQVLDPAPWLARAQVTVAPAGTLRLLDSRRAGSRRTRGPRSTCRRALDASASRTSSYATTWTPTRSTRRTTPSSGRAVANVPGAALGRLVRRPRPTATPRSRSTSSTDAEPARRGAGLGRTARSSRRPGGGPGRSCGRPGRTRPGGRAGRWRRAARRGHRQPAPGRAQLRTRARRPVGRHDGDRALPGPTGPAHDYPTTPCPTSRTVAAYDGAAEHRGLELSRVRRHPRPGAARAASVRGVRPGPIYTAWETAPLGQLRRASGSRRGSTGPTRVDDVALSFDTFTGAPVTSVRISTEDRSAVAEVGAGRLGSRRQHRRRRGHEGPRHRPRRRARRAARSGSQTCGSPVTTSAGRWSSRDGCCPTRPCSSPARCRGAPAWWRAGRPCRGLRAGLAAGDLRDPGLRPHHHGGDESGVDPQGSCLRHPRSGSRPARSHRWRRTRCASWPPRPTAATRRSPRRRAVDGRPETGLDLGSRRPGGCPAADVGPAAQGVERPAQHVSRPARRAAGGGRRRRWPGHG